MGVRTWEAGERGLVRAHLAGPTSMVDQKATAMKTHAYYYAFKNRIKMDKEYLVGVLEPSTWVFCFFVFLEVHDLQWWRKVVQKPSKAIRQGMTLGLMADQPLRISVCTRSTRCAVIGIFVSHLAKAGCDSVSCEVHTVHPPISRFITLEKELWNN